MSHALQVYFEDNDFRVLENWASQRGWTLSQAVRVAVRALTRSSSNGDPLLGASGMIDGLPPDLSQRFDSHLLSTYVAEPPVRDGTKSTKRRSRKSVRR